MIDPAFISRVNLGIKFPELDSETRLQIWNKILGGLDGSNKADWLIGDVHTLKKWATQPLNGRQIRNVVYSARLLADPPIFGKLTREGIEECLQDVIKFSKQSPELPKKKLFSFLLLAWFGVHCDRSQCCLLVPFIRPSMPKSTPIMDY
jgi:hypothetical protein